MLVKKNFGLSNIYNGEGKRAEVWLSTLEALKNDISPQRLYNMAKNSLRGTMIHWFNAFEDDEFNDLETMIKFFKKEFQTKDDDDKELKLWELIIKGPEGRDILEFIYEIKSLSKNISVSLSMIKKKFGEWVNNFIFEK
ncbi:hypothetical protein DMUE_2410 [Dictyocoela muelleri]|nr:hypothetical protein DMUE_2410 [Dictyocoela muelleri]